MMSVTMASVTNPADSACEDPATLFTALLRCLDAAERSQPEAVVLAMIDLLRDVFD